jgi:hypothetical protein
MLEVSQGTIAESPVALEEAIPRNISETVTRIETIKSNRKASSPATPNNNRFFQENREGRSGIKHLKRSPLRCWGTVVCGVVKIEAGKEE